MDWTSIANQALGAVLVACVPWALSKVGPLISAAFDYIESKTSAQWARNLEGEAEQIVLALWESTAKQAKQALADGKITKDEAAAILTGLGVEGRRRLGEWLKGMPARFQPQVEQKVGAALEAALAKLKVIKGMPPASVPTSGAPVQENAGGSVRL